MRHARMHAASTLHVPINSTRLPSAFSHTVQSTLMAYNIILENGHEKGARIDEMAQDGVLEVMGDE